MYYESSKERVEALEALARAYSQVIDADEKGSDTSDQLLRSITKEVKMIKQGQKHLKKNQSLRL